MAQRQLPSAILEQHITALICFNDEQAVALVAELPEDFYATNKALSTIFKKVVPYVKQQNRAPGELLPDLLFTEVNRGDTEAKLIEREMKLLADCVSRIDTQLVRSDVAAFLEARRIETAAQVLLQGIESDPTVALEEFFQRASPASSATSGLAAAEINMRNSAAIFARRREEQDERNQFHFPIRCLEELHVAPRRKRVMTLAGPTHKGKSHLMRETVYVNLRYHHVMHVVLEVGDEPEIAYWMHAYQLTKHPASRTDRTLLTRVKTPALAIEDNELKVTYTFREADCVDHQEEFIRQHESNFANLHLYKHAPNSLTFQMIRQELDRLSRAGIRIDMVAIDYPSVMKTDPKRETRLEEARLAREFSQLTSDYNVAGIGISQLNAEGNKAKKPNKLMMNESIDKSFIGDDILIIAQDEDAEEAQVAYVIYDKGRGEQHGMVAALGTCLATGQFCLCDVLVNRSEVNEVRVVQSGSQDEQILTYLRENLMLSNVNVAAALNVSPDRVDRIARAFLTTAERQQRGERRGRPSTRTQ